MEYKKHVLVVRLSALGDVAILAPVVRRRAEANPDVLFTIAAPALLQPFFDGLDNVRYLPTKKAPSRQLYAHLAQVHPTMIADMHRINRIVGADLIFLLHGIPVHAIKKYHWARHRLVRSRHKILRPLISAEQRYEDVFDACGLKSLPQPQHQIHSKGEELSQRSASAVKSNLMGTGNNSQSDFKSESDKIAYHAKTIGIAPFSQHQGKIWPLEKMEALVSKLSQRSDCKLLLFGGKTEAAILQSWAERYPNVESLAGKYAFEEELKRIQHLDVMVSMDSANMHFASYYGVPVVSVWGATHPYAGFYGCGQNPEWAVQMDLPCRPCSAYGNKPCRFGDYRCMELITVEKVLETIDKLMLEE